MRSECWIECCIEYRGLNRLSTGPRTGSLHLIDQALDSAL